MHWERRRILRDYDPSSDRTEEEWLAAECDAGFPEHGHGIPIELTAAWCTGGR